ncbi:MAG: glycosyl transferase family 2, partial [Clostridiales bacterium]|nr:glycosyl transferase family 2 [Clostridiales bacterium]
MKIYIYAISKNESKFAERFLSAATEADGVYVLDTGSTDDTVKKLRAGGAHVQTQTFSPFRFDVARNASLALVPDDGDVYLCLDLDEVLENGWRQHLENAVKAAPNANRFLYRYVWSHNPDGSDGVVYWAD